MAQHLLVPEDPGDITEFDNRSRIRQISTRWAQRPRHEDSHLSPFGRRFVLHLPKSSETSLALKSEDVWPAVTPLNAGIFESVLSQLILDSKPRNDDSR